MTDKQEEEEIKEPPKNGSRRERDDKGEEIQRHQERPIDN
jgi:hypothetical protein